MRAAANATLRAKVGLAVFEKEGLGGKIERVSGLRVAEARPGLVAGLNPYRRH